MIITRSWYADRKWNGYYYEKRYLYTGWFLFGFIPLYICRKETDKFGNLL